MQFEVPRAAGWGSVGQATRGETAPGGHVAALEPGG